ncbi:hypothetical protein [Palleronia sp. LCG004]|uniref:hypothetical protein n=1 Tax=Palleronia sp. LCG004 TaxID=3079304 RepID=UPI00294261C4|nr:hypothetical protein [Palleronia sp. LCG004]WOI54971.1 hypothetical protein RVY76_07790 [Palleronia sp. LCG004]
MDSKEQGEGERNVRKLLIEPLKRRGLAKPSSLTRAEFDAMVEDLCARLAYMSDTSLAALEEQVAANPGGKDKDRMPIANLILGWAGQIEPPGDGASPLIRAVFAHDLGRRSIEEGWSVELLAEVRRGRRWPTPFVVGKVRDAGTAEARKLESLDMRQARDGTLPPADARWRSERHDALRKCATIAELGG